MLLKIVFFEFQNQDLYLRRRDRERTRLQLAPQKSCVKFDVFVQYIKMTDIVNKPLMRGDQALQTALELSMLNMSSGNLSSSPNDQSCNLFEEYDAGQKSQNITQCVPVPSSEHVAEIVGRQGEGVLKNISAATCYFA